MKLTIKELKKLIKEQVEKQVDEASQQKTTKHKYLISVPIKLYKFQELVIEANNPKEAKIKGLEKLDKYVGKLSLKRMTTFDEVYIEEKYLKVLDYETYGSDKMARDVGVEFEPSL